MRHFPLFLGLEGQEVAIVGDGEAAVAKLRLLARTPARLRLFSPRPSAALREAAAALGAVPVVRDPVSADLAGCRLVVIATDDPSRRARIAECAGEAGALVNAVDDPALCDVLVPAIVDRDPVVVAVGTEGEAPMLARRIRARIEAMLPERTGRLARFAGRLRPRVTARFVSATARREFFDRLFDGPAASLVLAGREAEAASLAERMLQRGAEPSGSVSLLAVDTDDPDLLTLAAAARLQRADLLVIDAEVPERIVERARRDAERVRRCPVPGCPDTDHAELLRLVVQAARAGRRVVRLVASRARLLAEKRALEAAGVAAEALPGTAPPLAPGADPRRAVPSAVGPRREMHA